MIKNKYKVSLYSTLFGALSCALASFCLIFSAISFLIVNKAIIANFALMSTLFTFGILLAVLFLAFSIKKLILNIRQIQNEKAIDKTKSAICDTSQSEIENTIDDTKNAVCDASQGENENTIEDTKSAICDASQGENENAIDDTHNLILNSQHSKDNQAIKKPKVLALDIICLIFVLITSISCIALFVVYMFVDYFQPLTLFTAGAIFFALSGLFFLIGQTVNFAFRQKITSSLLLVASLSIVMLSVVGWANTQSYGTFYNNAEHTTVFANGECGYATFRIPSLCVIEGADAESDTLIAFAEARESSKDIGKVDLVCKISNDSGKTWSSLKNLRTFDGNGKIGNPTAVYLKATNEILLFFMEGTKTSGYQYKTFIAKGILANNNLIFDFDAKIDVSNLVARDASSSGGGSDGVTKNTLMAGPGKGIVLDSGRIVFPASNRGEGFAIFSDDGGKTWKKGGSAGVGNECEIAQLADGKLVMVLRDNINCAGAHPKQFLKFSVSDDGGDTWSIKNFDSKLKTPICMVSVTSQNGKMYCSFLDDFFTRARLSIAVSENGLDFYDQILLYGGAAGYSVAHETSASLYVLAEIGKVQYNEELHIFKIKK